MKKLKPSLLCLFLVVLPTIGLCNGFPSFQSEVPGVSIWVLNTESRFPFPHEGVDDRNYEFISYCDGINTVYVHEFRKRAPCKSFETYKGRDGLSTYRIDLIHTGNFLNKKVTVSKKNIDTATYTVSEPSINDMNSVAKVLASRKLALDSANKDYAISEYEQQIKEVINSIKFKEAMNRNIVVSLKNIKYFILPIGAELQGLGWNLRSAVFLLKNEETKYIGEINGCLDDVLDINSDGIPEIGATLCENSEGIDDSYWALFPYIKQVVSRSQ